MSNIPTVHEGKASIVVNLRNQRGYLYRGGVEVAEADISTGREGYETPAGHYRVIRKDHDHRSSLYGDYVDDDGQVVKANVDVRKDPKPAHSHYLGVRCLTSWSSNHVTACTPDIFLVVPHHTDVFDCPIGGHGSFTMRRRSARQ